MINHKSSTNQEILHTLVINLNVATQKRDHMKYAHPRQQ